MATIAALSCDISPVYAGKNRCNIFMAAPRMLLGLPKGTIITAANAANLQTYLNGILTDDDVVDRGIVISQIVGVEDNSEESVNFTYADGSYVQTREVVYRLTFEHKEGWCYQSNLMDLNSSFSKYDWFIGDQNNVLWGTEASDGSTGIQGVTPSFMRVKPMTMPTFDAPSRFMFVFEVTDTTQLNQNGRFVNAGFNLVTGLDGVQGVDVGLVSWVSGAAGTVNVSASTACMGLNMVTEFGDELDAAGAWVATNYATGNAITITAITQTTISGVPALLFDFDATDPDWPGLAGIVALRLADVSVIAALGVEFYESNTLLLTVPA